MFDETPEPDETHRLKTLEELAATRRLEYDSQGSGTPRQDQQSKPAVVRLREIEQLLEGVRRT
jgi:hypothetical protein